MQASATEEFYLVVTDERRPKEFIDLAQWYDGRRVWWGPGAERKAKQAASSLNRKLPAYHFCTVDSVLTF
jgi:hypothetical protein